MSGIGLFDEVNVYLPPRRYSLKIALVYPSTYEASITNLFTHVAYYFLTENLNALVDRFTLDNPDRGAITGLSLKDFDIALVSIGFELDIFNLVEILVRNNINTRKRGLKPLIIVGGLPVIANPLPYLPMCDAAFIGEGEAFLATIKDLFNEYGKEIFKENKFDELIHELYERTRSIYSKILLNNYAEVKVRKSIVKDFSRVEQPICLIRSKSRSPIYGDGYYIEISRGCKWLCAFCLEAFTTYPPRYRNEGLILNLIEDGVKCIGVNRVVFYSLSFFDHPKADDILEHLVKNNIKFSVPSLRYTTLNERRIDLIALGGQRTITIAPETAEEHASCLIRKKLERSLLRKLISYIISQGLNVKLYFMLGIPGESPNAGKSIAKLLREIISSTRLTRKEQIRMTINPLIPKPQTPTQYIPLMSKEDLKRKIKDLKTNVDTTKIRIDVYDWNYAYTQALIALGNECIGKLVIDVVLNREGLARFRKYAQDKLNYDKFIFRIKEPNEELPWDNIDLGLKHIVRSLGEKLIRAL